MASNLKKASSMLKKSFRSRRYASFDCKENMDRGALTRNVGSEEEETFRTRLSTSVCSSGDGSERNVSTIANSGSPAAPPSQTWLKRGTSMTQSMREAVGTIRQKLRMSTRRARQQVTSRNGGTRRHTIGGRESRVRSPFKASTPTKAIHIKTCLSKETPTRLRREVESLTSNLQALSALTPNTVEGRSRIRKMPQTLTNGSLKTPRTVRRHVVTDIN